MNPLIALSSMATRALFSELISGFEARTGQAVSLESIGGVDAVKRIETGEQVDLVVLAADAIDGLLAKNRLTPGSRVDLVRSGIAVAVREGRERPDIGSEAALRKAVLSARSIGYSTGPSGRHLTRLFEHWGIVEQVSHRVVQASPGTPVGALVADGTVELGFQQLSELIDVPGVAVLGLLPPAAQAFTIFAGAIGTSSERPDQVRGLLDFLSASEHAETIRRHGMEPVSPPIPTPGAG